MAPVGNNPEKQGCHSENRVFQMSMNLVSKCFMTYEWYAIGNKLKFTAQIHNFIKLLSCMWTGRTYFTLFLWKLRIFNMRPCQRSNFCTTLINLPRAYGKLRLSVSRSVHPSNQWSNCAHTSGIYWLSNNFWVNCNICIFWHHSLDPRVLIQLLSFYTL